MDYSKLSLEELAELQKKHREQMAENRANVEARKARTRRLIRQGAILEKILPGAAEISDEELEDLLRESLL